MLGVWKGWMNREREKKTQGSWNDSMELKGWEYGRNSKRVMAGGRGVSSSCQDRGWTRVGKKGREIEQCNLWDPTVCRGERYVEAEACTCVSTSLYGAHCVGRSESWSQALGLLCVWDWEGGISGEIAPRGAPHGGERQSACLACWLQPLDEA